MSATLMATVDIGLTQVMSLDGGDPNGDLHGDENETSKKSERKRQREKQRRSDLSNAFDELAAFIVEVEPETGEAEADIKKKRKKSGEGDESTGITRLDLIGHALRIMKRLHRENEERRRIIANTHDRGTGWVSNDNVLVMVPTLTPASEHPYPVARASYPSYPPPPTYYSNGHFPHNPPPPEYSVTSPPPGRPQSQYPPNWSTSYGRRPPLPPPTRMQNTPPPHSYSDQQSGPQDRR